MNNNFESIVSAFVSIASAEKEYAQAFTTYNERLATAFESIPNALWSIRGASAAVSKGAKVQPATVARYAVSAHVWNNADNEEEVAPSVLHSAVNSAVNGGISLDELREIAQVVETVGDFIGLVKSALEDSVKSDNAKGEEVKPAKEKKSQLSVILAALPNLTPEELSEVMDACASLAGASMDELVNA